MAWFEAMEFRRGLAFSEAARDPVISEWPKMKAHLVGSNHVVPGPAWDRIIDLLVSRNPDARPTVDAWSSEVPEAEARSLDDFVPADVYEGEPLFKREAEMEAFVRDFFINERVARLPTPDDGLNLRGQQDRLDPTARADLLMVAEESEMPTLGIVECKLWAGSVANIAQIERYADLLDELLPEGWGLTGHLVAEGFSDVVVQAAKDAGIVCWQFFEDEHGELFIAPIVSPNEPQPDAGSE